MQHLKSKINIDPTIQSDTCMETTFFVKNKNKEWKMSPNSKLREVTEAKTETAGKGANSLIFLQGLMREVLETYKPNLLTRRRRLIEDFVRDLMLNNDHIHVVEQQMR